jgi:hypothetical protein
LLEYQWAAALWGPLAGLLKFAATVCRREEDGVPACGGKC